MLLPSIQRVVRLRLGVRHRAVGVLLSRGRDGVRSVYTWMRMIPSRMFFLRSKRSWGSTPREGAGLEGQATSRIVMSLSHYTYCPVCIGQQKSRHRDSLVCTCNKKNSFVTTGALHEVNIYINTTFSSWGFF